MDLHHVLQSPVVTEKSNAKQANHVYTFLVHADANKIEIANAVQQEYGVTVKQVRVMSVQKKVRLVGRGRVVTKRHAAKKALVTLDDKQSLDFNKFSKK